MCKKPSIVFSLSTPLIFQIHLFYKSKGSRRDSTCKKATTPSQSLSFSSTLTITHKKNQNQKYTLTHTLHFQEAIAISHPCTYTESSHLPYTYSIINIFAYLSSPSLPLPSLLFNFWFSLGENSTSPSSGGQKSSNQERTSGGLVALHWTRKTPSSLDRPSHCNLIKMVILYSRHSHATL